MVERGQLWWAQLPEPAGSEPGFRRPVIIAQANEFNQSRLKTVVVIAVSSNLRLADAPGNVLLTKSKTGLSKDSVANVSQILTLDKQTLGEEIGRLDARTIRRLNQGMELVLGL
jgi:mRNA interferase MazF